MPRSPWLASLGCTKKAGVPVEAKVAASFWPMCPLLPMPVTMTRPCGGGQNANGAVERLPQLAFERGPERRQTFAFQIERARRRLSRRRRSDSEGHDLELAFGAAHAHVADPLFNPACPFSPTGAGLTSSRARSFLPIALARHGALQQLLNNLRPPRPDRRVCVALGASGGGPAWFRDRFVAVFPLGPIAAGSLGPASALTIAVAIALANHPGEQPKRAEERNGGAHGGPPETCAQGPPGRAQARNGPPPARRQRRSRRRDRPTMGETNSEERRRMAPRRPPSRPPLTPGASPTPRGKG